MKKILAIVILLSLLSIGSFYTIASAVSREKESVAITENIIYGDKSYAEGITVSTLAHYDHHLLWNTDYTIGATPSITTDYEFHYSDYNISEERESFALSLDTELNYEFPDVTVPDEERVGIAKVFQDLYNATPEGSTGKKTIRLQDYYDYYPIHVGLNLPGTLWQGIDYESLDKNADKYERAVWDTFREFFKVPIPEDLPAFEITINKEVDTLSIGHEGIDYQMNPQSIYTKDTLFFSINNEIGSSYMYYNQYIDTSLIPGGYGIYAFRYKNVRTSESTKDNTSPFGSGYETGIEADTLSMVFPLEQHAKVIKMFLSNDESKLLLFTLEDGVTYLSVIDILSMTELQKIKVTEDTQYEFYEYDTCIVLMNRERISVIEKQADGLCRLALTVSTMTDIDDNIYHQYDRSTMAFDGENLIMVTYTRDRHFKVELCGFSVAIYNNTGLVYYAEYESNLSTTNILNSDINCLSLRYSISWEE